MSQQKAKLIWWVDVVLFGCLVLLGITGIMNGWVLPKGQEAWAEHSRAFRHFLMEIHEWTAILFLITASLHLWLHWGYIRNQLKKYGIMS